MNSVVTLLFLFAGFFVLIYAAKFFVEGAASAAKKFALPEITIGLTVVAFGTSAPELIINVQSAIKGVPDFVFGNIIGSNLVNILLILGLSGLLTPLICQKNTVWKEIPFSLLAVIALFVLCNDYFFSGSDNVLTRGDGITLLLFFIIFIIYVFGMSNTEAQDSEEIQTLSLSKTIIFIAGGLFGLVLGGKIVVDNAVVLAESLGLSTKIIGFTILAVGTSLPELVTSTVAAYKGKSDIAVGNIVGSNIFNIFFILGITPIITPLPFEQALNVDLILLVVASLLLFLAMFTGKKKALDRWEAVLFLLTYIGYVLFLILRK